MPRDKRDLGRVRRKDTRRRISRESVERKERWDGKEDLGVYNAILRLLQESGFGDPAWWHVARESDRKFVKEGRAVVTPGNWDEIVFTAPTRGAIIITRVDFYFPERIGRRFGDLSFWYQGDKNMYDYESERSGEGPGPATVYDTLVPDRWLIQDGKEIAYRMENTHLAADAIFDFRIRGWTVAGGVRRRVRR